MSSRVPLGRKTLSLVTADRCSQRIGSQVGHGIVIPAKCGGARRLEGHLLLGGAVVLGAGL